MFIREDEVRAFALLFESGYLGHLLRVPSLIGAVPHFIFHVVSRLILPGANQE